MRDLIKIGYVREINTVLKNGIKKKEYALTFEGSWKVNGWINDFEKLDTKTT